MRNIALAVALASMAIGCVAQEGGEDEMEDLGGGGGGGTGSGSGSGSGSGTSNVTCTAAATVSADVSVPKIEGVGTLTCTGSAALSVETCLQWKSAGSSTFSDIGCTSQSKSGVSTLATPFSSGCGIGEKLYRTQVRAKLDGQMVAEAVSNEINCN
jgi:hypothetical protein